MEVKFHHDRMKVEVGVLFSSSVVGMGFTCTLLCTWSHV